MIVKQMEAKQGSKETFRERYAWFTDQQEEFWHPRYRDDTQKIPRWVGDSFMSLLIGSITPEMIDEALRRHDMDAFEGRVQKLITVPLSDNEFFALIVIGLMVLWAALCGVVVLMWKQSIKGRLERDRLRDAWKAGVDARLKSSEEKHGQCEKDRDCLQRDFEDVRERIQRFEKCSAGERCPMRLP
jgi:hypothetical protein